MMNILIVEDQPMASEALITFFSGCSLFSVTPAIIAALSCKEAFIAIEKAPLSGGITLALVDQSLPSSPEHGLYNGSDVALLLKEKFENCKIIIMTAHAEVLVVYDLLQRSKPDGFLIKCDIDCNS